LNVKIEDSSSFSKFKNRFKIKRRSSNKYINSKSGITNLGNTAVNRYSKHSSQKRTVFGGIDVISIVKLLPINNKFIIMMLLSI
jgi:hypothetical protein